MGVLHDSGAMDHRFRRDAVDDSAAEDPSSVRVLLRQTPKDTFN
jgi:hypothetical protein